MSIAERAQVWECTNEEYHLDYSIVGNSMAKKFDGSRCAYGAMFVTRTAPPEAYTDLDCSYDVLLGSLTHLILEKPKDWQASILEYTLTKGTDTKAYRKFCDDNPDRDIYTPAQIKDAQLMAESVRSHEIARQFFNTKGVVTEQAIAWVCDHTGLRRKCKPDSLNLESEIIGDFKTTACKSRHEWYRQIEKMKHYRQAQWYEGGVAAKYDVLMPFAFIRVQNKWPFETFVCELKEDYLDGALAENVDNLTNLADCYRRHEQGDPTAWDDPFKTIIDKVPTPYRFTKKRGSDGDGN